MPASPCFISCDWGTTHLRLRLVEMESASVIKELKTADGAAACFARIQHGVVSAEQVYAQVLLAQAQELLREQSTTVTDVVVSGMACSRIGWKDVPYAEVPAQLNGTDLNGETVFLPWGEEKLAVHLIGGLKTANDVLRGEEIETIGLALLDPDLFRKPARLILPGTHSKHLMIAEGKIVSFTTYMTGELYSQLSAMPTLKPCLENGKASSTNPAFREGVAMSADSGFLASLFKTRSLNVLGKFNPTDAASFLSGLLIGGELSDCRGTQSRLVIATGEPLKSLYEAAVRALELDDVHFLPEKTIENAVPFGHRQLLSLRTR